MKKKIILIDDNSKNQRIAYGASFVDEEKYSKCLYHVEKLNSQSDLSFLDDALCVMMHDSLEDYIGGEFVSSSHKGKEKIEDFIQANNIPYVLFSDGHGMTAEWREDTPDVVYSIKKSEFYRNLESFVLKYDETGILDMRIIAYGKDFMKELICKWCQNVLLSINTLNDIDKIAINLVDKRSLRLVIENAQPKIGITFDELMCNIEDEEITTGAVRNNLNSIISSMKKYGKNISSWK